MADPGISDSSSGSGSSGLNMQIIINKAACVGHGRCKHVAPELFSLDDNGYIATVSFNLPAGAEALAQRGVRACPEGALSLADAAPAAAALPTIPTLIFIEHQGREHRVQVEPGTSVMQAALNAGVPGILADCGGSCSCGTCHGYLEGEVATGVVAASDNERDMLDCAIDVSPHSRLTCQLIVTAAMDGLVIRLPRSQI